jgi:hypothetical protein
MSKNGYLEKKQVREQTLLDIGVKCGKQQIVDYLACVLRNPKYVGKDIFGRERIDLIMAGLEDYDKEYCGAYTNDKEADVKQEHLDAELRAVYKDELVPFVERQPYVMIYNYNKPKKGWVD